MTMTPDYDRSATAAMEILIKHRITETPVASMGILLEHPHVRVMSFSSIADNTEVEREDLIPQFGNNQDACTFKMIGMDDVDYIVVYNMRLPYEEIRRSIARELGHIVLGHDGQSRSTAVRREEALCFAHHLLTPRPIIHMLQNSDMPLTMNVLAHTTGCSEDCVEEIREIPGANVPPEINRQVKELFAPHIMEYLRFHKSTQKKDGSPVINFGTYMDNYME